MRRLRWWAAIAGLASLAGALVLPSNDEAAQPLPPARLAVAVTPAGALETVRVTDGVVEISGWVSGDAANRPVHIRVGDRTLTTTTADGLRPDLAVVDPTARTFRVTVSPPDTAHSVCVDLPTGDAFTRLGCGAADPSSADAAHAALDALVDRLGADIESEIPGVRVAIAVVPVDTGRLAGWRENRLFISASTAKSWWVAAALAAGAADDVASIAAPIFEVSSDLLAGDAMDLAGGIDAVNAFTESAGMADTGAMKWGFGDGRRFASDFPGPLSGSNHVDASDAAEFFHRLGTNQILPPIETALLAEWMRLSPRDTSTGESEASMMTDALPRRVAAATEHKAGWLEPDRFSVDPHLLDTGIVRPRRTPAYALALMAAGPVDASGYSRLQQGLRDASCEIYRHLADPTWRC